jgi:hypothetical protein
MREVETIFRNFSKLVGFYHDRKTRTVWYPDMVCRNTWTKWFFGRWITEKHGFQGKKIKYVYFFYSRSGMNEPIGFLGTERNFQRRSHIHFMKKLTQLVISGQDGNYPYG